MHSLVSGLRQYKSGLEEFRCYDASACGLLLLFRGLGCGGVLGLPGRVMLSFHLEFDQAGTVFLRCSQIMQ